MMIDSKLWLDKRFRKLSIFGRLVFIGMISQANDEGILNPDPNLIHTGMGYFASSHTPEQVATEVQNAFEVGLAVHHQVDGTPYAKLMHE